MSEELVWNVGREAAGAGSLKKAIPKAFFYWKRHGQIVRSADFTHQELEDEIKRLHTLGEDTTQHSAALKKLKNEMGKSIE